MAHDPATSNDLLEKLDELLQILGGNENDSNDQVLEMLDELLQILDGNENDSNTVKGKIPVDSTGTFYEMRVHPSFLWSNARKNCTCFFKAVIELVKNSISEICKGATFVSVGTLTNRRDGSHMLLFADDCCGMDPIRMRHCMSLGYSTHGQDGLGFQTSTMWLGSDVIVFSRCSGQHRSTQCAALLSYTFLSKTGSDSIVVPLLHYEKDGEDWKIANGDISTMLHWSPFATEERFLEQFDLIGPSGTRVIVFNLRKDNMGLSELDFQTDGKDSTIKGASDSLKCYLSKVDLGLPLNGFQFIFLGEPIVQVLEEDTTSSEDGSRSGLLFVEALGGGAVDAGVGGAVDAAGAGGAEQMDEVAAEQVAGGQLEVAKDEDDENEVAAEQVAGVQLEVAEDEDDENEVAAEQVAAAQLEMAEEEDEVAAEQVAGDQLEVAEDEDDEDEVAAEQVAGVQLEMAEEDDDDEEDEVAAKLVAAVQLEVDEEDLEDGYEADGEEGDDEGEDQVLGEDEEDEDIDMLEAAEEYAVDEFSASDSSDSQ